MLLASASACAFASASASANWLNLTLDLFFDCSICFFLYFFLVRDIRQREREIYI